MSNITVALKDRVMEGMVPTRRGRGRLADVDTRQQRHLRHESQGNQLDTENFSVGMKMLKIRMII